MWTSSYWLLVLAVGLRNTVHSGLSFLLVPVLVWFLQGSGRSETDSLAIAIPLVGALSLATMVFNPLVGWLGDSWSKLKLSAVTMVAGVLSVLLLMDQSGRVWQATLFVILLSFSESSNPLAWAILGDFFGRRSFATLRGWQHLPDQFMSAATPWWMGLIFDYQGSYVWALVPLVVLYGLSAIIFLIVPVPTPPVRSNAQSQADAIAGR
jgi:MFS family permease